MEMRSLLNEARKEKTTIEDAEVGLVVGESTSRGGGERGGGGEGGHIEMEDEMLSESNCSARFEVCIVICTRMDAKITFGKSKCVCDTCSTVYHHCRGVA